MNKAELVAVIAKKTGLSQKDSAAALKAFTDTVTAELKKKDGKVQLVGFGTFAVSKRKAREGRNPPTGEYDQDQSGEAPEVHGRHGS